MAKPTWEGQGTNPCEGKEPYALMVLGDSMYPEFNEGDVITIEPESVVVHENYVVAYHNDEYIFRQLVISEGRFFLKPVNDLYPVQEISGLEAIKGKITQKKVPGGGRNGITRYV